MGFFLGLPLTPIFFAIFGCLSGALGAVLYSVVAGFYGAIDRLRGQEGPKPFASD